MRGSLAQQRSASRLEERGSRRVYISLSTDRVMKKTKGTDGSVHATRRIPLMARSRCGNRFVRPEFFITLLNVQRGSGRQRRRQIDWFTGDGVEEFQILGVQEISAVAREAGEVLQRLAG